MLFVIFWCIIWLITLLKSYIVCLQGCISLISGVMSGDSRSSEIKGTRKKQKASLFLCVFYNNALNLFCSQIYKSYCFHKKNQWKLKYTTGGVLVIPSYHSLALWPEEPLFCTFNLLNENPLTADDSCCVFHACT